MTFLPSVTVIVATKNNRNTIRQCVESLLNLKYDRSRLKIIVVDSSDNSSTFELLAGLPVSLMRFEGNAPAAYNFALKQVTTELVGFVDGDAIVEPGWLIELIDGCGNPEVAGSGGSILTWNRDRLFPRAIGYELESRYNHPKQVIPTSTTNLVVRKSVLDEIGGFDEMLATGYDADLGFRVTRLGLRIDFKSRAVVYHHHRSNLRAYIRQQYSYGKNNVRLYSKNPGLLKSNNITKRWMIVQPMLITTVGLFCMLGLMVPILPSLNQVGPISTWLIAASVALGALLVGSYGVSSLELALKVKDLSAWPILFLIMLSRVLAWTVGGGIGLLTYAAAEDS